MCNRPRAAFWIHSHHGLLNVKGVFSKRALTASRFASDVPAVYAKRAHGIHHRLSEVECPVRTAVLPVHVTNSGKSECTVKRYVEDTLR